MVLRKKKAVPKAAKAAPAAEPTPNTVEAAITRACESRSFPELRRPHQCSPGDAIVRFPNGTTVVLTPEEAKGLMTGCAVEPSIRPVDTLPGVPTVIDRVLTK